ncbi:MAG TPA: hypothetical protein VNA19_02715 [Pyrinomonadaceae bacterium]|jgi:hypothetical protein|nr:hypothetical protein [Pyrinomonadaceae bacterium]
MKTIKLSLSLLLLLALVAPSLAVARAQATTTQAQVNARMSWMKDSMSKLESELVSKYGEAQRARLVRGMGQVADFWRAEDGDAAAFEEFVRTNFAGQQATLDTMFERFQRNLEQLDGHMQEIGREFAQQSDLDAGEILSFDELFAGYSPSAHVTDDFFRNKLAFIVLLNFPLTTLQQRLAEGERWTRRQWAEARLAQRFSKRIPAEVNLANAQAAAEAGRYIAEYNIWMHHLLDDKGARLFPPKLRLLSHWNLRDEIKADYSDAQTGLAKQRMIQQVMERIVTQTIPAVVVNNPQVDWNPFTNEVRRAAVKDAEGTPANAASSAPTNAPEPNTRYAKLLLAFNASRKADPYSPTAPTLIARRFDESREIPEARVRAMLEEVLSSPLVPQVARLIESRLGRPLEPFDIWYNGFRPRGAYTEAQLDEIVAKRYPTAEAYKKDMPNLLTQLGFSKERAEYLANNIIVDPARGSGHAMGAAMRTSKTHLRTRVEKTGMNYKGFNIAVHEMGHNVEQTFSLNNVDHTLLQGVPNTAFTEALAFVFQNRDLELLGLTKPDAKTEALKTLNDFWGTFEIAGVALVDMGVWHWMYDHPNATPAELRDATVRIAQEIWNKYYAPVFKRRDVPLLAVYSHMIDSFLYLPDYPIGHLIAFQIEGQMEKAGNVGAEFERMATVGNVAPDIWMKRATGAPVGADALLTATKRALVEVGKN